MPDITSVEGPSSPGTGLCLQPTAASPVSRCAWVSTTSPPTRAPSSSSTPSRLSLTPTTTATPWTTTSC
uniref:Uncharacterized protein n=1 Tax=Anguilla anguilla TaxID=7936 RepID=A0A0E9WKE8_ANGAN